MRDLRTLHCVLSFVLFLLVCDAQSSECRRSYTQSGPDCRTRNDMCSLSSDFGAPSINGLPFPRNNRYICYRTCYENGEDGRCIFRAGNRFITGNGDITDRDLPQVGSMQPGWRSWKLLSPRYQLQNGGKGNYRKTTICRYNIKCNSNELLYYGIVDQVIQNRVTCSGLNECVDILTLIFPGMGNNNCERCGTKNDPSNSNCPVSNAVVGSGGVVVEFKTNRETTATGFEISVKCIRQDFSQKKRQAELCTSPTGMGPRSFLPVPLADRIQRVLDRDPNATFIELEELDDFVRYNDSILSVTTSQYEESFRSIMSLEVENFLNTKRYFRIAPGIYSGFAQLAISENNAFLVQFGVNPNLLPSEQEQTIIALLDAAILDAVADQGQFDVLDEIDLLEQAENFNFAVASDLNSDTIRKKRGIESGFLDTLAIEYGNACNVVLRATACIYQEVILERNCTV